MSKPDIFVAVTFYDRLPHNRYQVLGTWYQVAGESYHTHISEEEFAISDHQAPNNLNSVHCQPSSIRCRTRTSKFAARSSRLCMRRDLRWVRLGCYCQPERVMLVLFNGMPVPFSAMLVFLNAMLMLSVLCQCRLLPKPGCKEIGFRQISLKICI